MSKVIGITGGSYILDDNGQKVYHGIKGVGKDTVATMIRDLYQADYDVHIFCFADCLKDFVEKFYGLTREQYDNQENKEIPIMIEGFEGWTYRKILEIFGTNVMRHEMDRNYIWIDKLVKKIALCMLSPEEQAIVDLYDMELFDFFNVDRNVPNRNNGLCFNKIIERLQEAVNTWKLPRMVKGKPKMVIIPDIRFYNEYQALKLFNGVKFLRIERKYSKSIDHQTHISNIVDENIVCDYVIDNNSTLDDLRDCIRSLKLF